MATQIRADTKVQTTVELPYVGVKGDAVIPAGTVGVVREVYADALGGYRVEFRLEGESVVTTAVYRSQFTAVS